MSRFVTVARSAVLVAAAAAATAYAAEPEKRGAVAPPSDTVKWNLERLNKDPFKLIKSVPDPRNAQVRFIVEFVRRPDLAEMFDWQNRGGPVLFHFLDEDGVVLRTVKPVIEGGTLTEKGSRFRLILPMPDPATLDHTRSITAQ